MCTHISMWTFFYSTVKMYSHHYCIYYCIYYSIYIYKFTAFISFDYESIRILITEPAFISTSNHIVKPKWHLSHFTANLNPSAPLYNGHRVLLYGQELNPPQLSTPRPDNIINVAKPIFLSCLCCTLWLGENNKDNDRSYIMIFYYHCHCYSFS